MYFNVESTINEINSNMETTFDHINNKNNPHDVTVAQIGAAPVDHTHPYLKYVE
jgi:hypothetical protein